MANKIKTDVVVLGSGPGGYTAAFRAADLDKKVVLVERFDSLGGVCLNVGCIPSKALLHIAKVVDEAHEMSEHGVAFGKPKFDNKKLVAWKNSVVAKLTGGLKALAKQRKVEVITGTGKFSGTHQILVETKEGTVEIEFDNAIIAVGSESIKLPFIPEDKRIFSSTGALELADIKGDLLVLGGGIIGLEMATVYSSLGVNVTVVEFMDQLIPNADADLVNILQKRMTKKGLKFLLKTKVTAVEAKKDGIYVSMEGEHATDKPLCFQQVLVAVGRKPNGGTINAEKAGIKVDERGFIPVDNQLRTNVPHIFAIGDVNGQPMLAHKAIPEGKVAAEVIAGKKHYFEPKCIPSVAYTDPELAWAGLTEKEAKEKGINYEKASFPWAASGRALSMGREEGMTKLLFCPETNRILGAGIVGVNAGDLIAETALAIEMCCDVEDIALTIHPHPTLSETIAQSAEAFEGTITDLYLPKKKKK
ncbi:TPA: dihydrolipoyl dehydrogenase [Legionella pneumophila]|uniref:Dihydrolipoyl dehydrogenase n=1 Tax=Legionella pneumophila TaxID=446 RepID=A0AAN5T9C1_LEGPN|nr:dihydrolipoyl dehydrogenase [Legionella pneumophila]TIH04700.1 dihydrolipoyl dehydrogenase [Legionella pneumophila]HAT3856413.1 dihydrolipoyl dehydrogenase [Legionella pneumophila]HAT3859235.1 dihydrolipoyl dehydrogenase [Legionella pneumophila]HAT3866109.1 dihydrolipoyl dehydrogenase [Legionella pneumophila]HAT3868912.1 dihydrolipoyl dehydrogenase [Legionella pneumophila]